MKAQTKHFAERVFECGMKGLEAANHVEFGGVGL